MQNCPQQRTPTEVKQSTARREGDREGEKVGGRERKEENGKKPQTVASSCTPITNSFQLNKEIIQTLLTGIIKIEWRHLPLAAQLISRESEVPIITKE